MLPLLKCLEDGKPQKMAVLYEKLATVFNLSEPDKNEKLSSGQSTYMSRISWARTYLKQAGLLSSPARSIIQITPVGTKALNSKVEKIDIKFLEQFPDFIKFTQKSNNKSTAASASGLNLSATPEEIMLDAWIKINKSISNDLLDRIKQSPPDFFERLVVDLMLAMGYGGTREDAGQVQGKSGDGGIDGIINEDRLGLDIIYIQAKRWKDSVGSPIIQGFIGSIVNHGANKGVIITTSTFTKDAELTARKNPQYKIILIDGEKLASLMIEYNLGVTTKETYLIKNIDQDYFDQA
jgi:restriction system protein